MLSLMASDMPGIFAALGLLDNDTELPGNDEDSDYELSDD